MKKGNIVIILLLDLEKNKMHLNIALYFHLNSYKDNTYFAIIGHKNTHLLKVNSNNK